MARANVNGVAALGPAGGQRAADAAGAPLATRTATRMMTVRDPWVNMLRTTLAAFGAVLATRERDPVVARGAGTGLAGGCTCELST